MAGVLLDNPFSQWEITTDCNMGCKSCQVRENVVLPPIPLDIAIATVDYLADAGIETLEFIGGEPYKYPYMLDLIRHIYYEQPKIKRFAVLTNAMDRKAISETKPFLSLTRGGIVVGINYTKQQCKELLVKKIDVAMAKKSIAGWEALDYLRGLCWIRVNCVINELNIRTFPEIASQVIKKGALFSCCPLVYKRIGTETPVTFRAKTPDLAPVLKHRQLVGQSVGRLIKIKKMYPNRIIPSEEYLNFLSQTCKRPEDPYSINCKGMGLPYLRISSDTGNSGIDGEISVKLRACTDIVGDNFSKIVVSDLKYLTIVANLADIYQRDPAVKKCQKEEGCPWSVTFALSR